MTPFVHILGGSAHDVGGARHTPQKRKIAMPNEGDRVDGSARRKGNSMSDDRAKQRSEADAELEREIRQGRKFTAQEAIGRMVGPGTMKGGSAVPRVQEAETGVGTWLRSNLTDSTGALQALLHRKIRGSEALLNNLDQPLLALASYCQQVLASDYHLEELVREADVEWGRRMDERPHFNREGSPPNPEDPYTNDSVRRALREVLTKISDAASGKGPLSIRPRPDSDIA